MPRKWWTKHNKIRAVHDNDLEEFLNSIGLLDPINNGELLCYVCGQMITMDNLGLIISRNNKYEAICDNLLCLGKNIIKEEIHE